MNRVLISAAHKSSGKTTVSIGICAALKRRGVSVQPFKKGPDYIDPMWLSQASGRTCRNLDLYLMQPEQVETTFGNNLSEFNLVEGNKGLYDGLALDGSNSNAAIAKLLNLPVVLVIDARGMTRGIAPLILGYQAFDRDIHIAGVILNNLGGSRHESKLREVIHHYTDVPVIGAIQHDKRLSIDERHLGLMPSNESTEATQLIQLLGDAVETQVDLDKLIDLSRTAAINTPPHAAIYAAPQPKVRIGVAHDRAFGFYYADDFDAMRAEGAEIIPFDTTRDQQLPEVDGLFIGGGFPEMLAAELEANTGMRHAIGTAVNNGMPVYAECGGLMYLSRNISYQGKTHAMVGAIPGDIVMHEKPVGRGYVTLTANKNHPWQAHESNEKTIRAHEFHYSSLDNLPADTKFAFKMERGHGIDGEHDGLMLHNMLACYTHQRSVGNCHWASRFVDFVRKHKLQQSDTLSDSNKQFNLFI